MTRLNKSQDAQLEILKTAIADGMDFLSSLADDADSHYDEKSEKWQEGEAGSAYAEWRDQLREAADELSNVNDQIQNLTAEPQS